MPLSPLRLFRTANPRRRETFRYRSGRAGARDRRATARCCCLRGRGLGDSPEGPDDAAREQRAHADDQLGGEEGERPEQLEHGKRGPEEGGHQDPDPAEERSEDGTDPQHEVSMG